MEFDIQGQDARFEPLRKLLRDEGHSVIGGPIIIAPPKERRGLPYYESESFALENGALTAEGAVALLMKNRRKALMASEVLVVGYGRTGRPLARRLRALGAAVTVAVRPGKSRTEAALDGFCIVDITNIGATYDAVINTVPAPLLRGSFGGALCLDLASAPGGWADGTVVLSAPGLPGLYDAKTAAVIMKEAIMEVCAWEN